MNPPLYDESMKPKEWDTQKIKTSRRQEMQFGIQDGTRFYE